MSPAVLIGLADALAALESAWCLADDGSDVHVSARHSTRSALARSKAVEISSITSPEQGADRSAADLATPWKRAEPGCGAPMDDHAVWRCDRVHREYSPGDGTNRFGRTVMWNCRMGASVATRRLAAIRAVLAPAPQRRPGVESEKRRDGPEPPINRYKRQVQDSYVRVTRLPHPQAAVSALTRSSARPARNSRARKEHGGQGVCGDPVLVVRVRTTTQTADHRPVGRRPSRALESGRRWAARLVG